MLSISKKLLWIKEKITARHNILRGSLFEYLLASLFFLAISMLITWPLPLNIGNQIFSQGPADASSGFVWLNHVDPELDPFLDYTDMASYPLGEHIGSPIFITYLLLWLPVRFFSFLFGPVAGINIVMYSGFVFTALAAYWLIKKLTSSIPASLLGGYALAFFPYAVAKGVNHLAYIFNIFFVLLLAAFIALWMKPNIKYAIIFGLTIALHFYFDGYFLLLAPVMVVALCLAGLIYGITAKFSKSDYILRLKMLLISLTVVVIGALPILGVKLIFSDQIGSTLGTSRSQIDVEIPYYRSWVIDFILPAADNPYLESSDQFQQMQEFRNTRSDKLSNISYIGLINLTLMVIGLALIGVWMLKRDKSSLAVLNEHTRKTYILVGVIAVVASIVFLSFMFSPYVSVLDKRIYLPGQIFMSFDINLWRNMSRFIGPLQVVIVVFAMFTLWVLGKILLSGKSQLSSKYIFAALAALLGLIMFIEYGNSINHPMMDYRKQGSGYNWLKDRDDIQVIAEFPIADPLDEISSRYSTMQVFHGKKMVNTKDPRYRVQSNALGSIENNETVDWAYLRGAQAIVTHSIDCKPPSWGRLVFSNRKDRMCIYKLDEPATSDNLFAVITSGVDPTPNYDIGQKNTSRLSDTVVNMQITDARFNPIRNDGKAMFSGKLFNWNSAAQPIEGWWVIKQGGKKVSEGKIEKEISILTATLEVSDSFQLEIYRQNKMNDLLLQDILVTSSSRF